MNAQHRSAGDYLSKANGCGRLSSDNAWGRTSVRGSGSATATGADGAAPSQGVDQTRVRSTVWQKMAWQPVTLRLSAPTMVIVPE